MALFGGLFLCSQTLGKGLFAVVGIPYLCIVNTSSMSQYTIHLDLEPYLAQWFIHEQGGEQPVSLTRGSAESDILELFLQPQPGATPVRPLPTDTAIYIPTFKHKDVRTYNYLPPRATLALKKTIRTRFVIQLWNDLYKFENIGKRNDELIYAWMEAHGIECNETNWCAISKIYYRKRKVYLAQKNRDN